MVKPVVTFSGEKQIFNALVALGGNAPKNVLRRSLSTPAKILKRKVKRNIPGRSVRNGRSGNLKKSVFAQRGRGTIDEVAWSVGFDPKIAPHAHLYHEGTAQRFWKSGKSTGRVIGKPVLRNTFNSNRQELLNSLINRISEEIKKEFRKILTPSKRKARR